MSKKLFTSESVTEGHPDKICDQVSDAILDKILEQDRLARVACETFVSTGMILVSGEITTNCYVDIPQIVRSTIKEIGYTDANYGFDFNTCAVLAAIKEQSPDIALGVDIGGAGDQGMMFGYANNETEELMPMAIMFSHQLCKKLSEIRKNKELTYLRPDGKSQVTVEYENDVPKRIHTVVVSTQHSPNVKYETLRQDIIEKVIKRVIPARYIDKETVFLVNPTGWFEVGGPQADTGLTGRKIIVDTYGGYARHGGGAFSGKDPTKLDRSAAYMARYICKNIVASGIAKECELQLSYAIGVEKPISIFVNTNGTAKVSDEKISKLIESGFDLTPKGIIDKLNLRQPIYKSTASYGHFGRAEFPWEKLDMINLFKNINI